MKIKQTLGVQRSFLDRNTYQWYGPRLLVYFWYRVQADIGNYLAPYLEGHGDLENRLTIGMGYYMGHRGY